MFHVFMIMLFSAFLVFGMSRKPKEDLQDLNKLKTECENLQVDLDSLGAKKWTKVIDAKVKECKDHGFWEFKKRKINTFTEEF